MSHLDVTQRRTDAPLTPHALLTHAAAVVAVVCVLGVLYLPLIIS
jgi:hypothetical protein